MGCIDLSKFSKKGANPNALFATQLKKGKSPEQCKCIDFFLGEQDGANKKKGCGCLKKKSEMTFEQYLQYVQNVVDRLQLKQRAIYKIGLDESQISEIPPIVLTSFTRNKAGDGTYVKYNDDNTLWVTNKFQVTWVFFSATQLYTYTYIFDTISNSTFETTRDFFYKDITCIRTEHEIEEAIYVKQSAAGCMKKESESYYHADKHWDTLQITVPNDFYSFECRTTDTIEQSIQAAKAMIREKKEF